MSGVAGSGVAGDGRIGSEPAAPRVLVLTDEPPEQDRRVLAVVSSCGPGAELLQIRPARGWLAATLGWLCVGALTPCALASESRWLVRIASRRRLSHAGFAGGLKRVAAAFATVIATLAVHRRRLRSTDQIYANDQLCGLIARVVRAAYGVPYVYDSHEFGPFRNRRYGFARRCVESFLERIVVAGARETVVVNQPIKRFYRRVYRAPALRVRLNDFFPEREITVRADGEPLLVYVGAVGPARRIDPLVAFAARMNCRSVLAVDRPDLIDRPPGAEGTKVIPLADYPEVLPDALAGCAPYFWCYFDAAILSYRFALPNKFFQALAYGLPIVAAEGTYVGQLVSRYKLGRVGPLEAMHPTDLWTAQAYARYRRNVRAFRGRLAAGGVSI